MSNDKAVNKKEFSVESYPNFPTFKVGERIGRYIKIKEVGSGSYGKAILVKDVYKGQEYVMKIINITKLSAKERRDAINEVKLLSSIRHPYIVCFKESFVDGGFLNIVMEYADGGDLFRRVSTQRQLKKNFLENQIVRWLTQALLGLAHLHNRKILHRDIKSQNMFLSYNGLKIGDFGIAKVLENTGAFAKTTIGTPYYLSPEICLSKPYSWSSDVWALGCVAYEMCSLKVPFDAPNLKSLVEKIINGDFLPIPNSYSEGLRKVIMDMLIIDSSQRPTVNELLKYPRIEAELKHMKKEAIAICKNKVIDKVAINYAASTIEIISAIQSHCEINNRELSDQTTSTCKNSEKNIFEKLQCSSGGRTASRVEETETEIQLNTNEPEKSKLSLHINAEGNESTIEECTSDMNNCSTEIVMKVVKHRSDDLANTQTCTTDMSYSGDEKNSTTTTKASRSENSDLFKTKSIHLFPFKLETSV